jgi:MerR family transcriptional regulator, heat shock protein HspR
MREQDTGVTAGRRVQARGQGGGDRGLYIISVAAELVGVHPQTLRIYERKGLLMPSRTAGNTRRYSERDIARLQTIQRLTQEGVNLAGVKRIVEMENELDRMSQRMVAMRIEMERAEQRLRQEVERVRREGRADLVPASDVDRLRRRLRVTGQERRTERRRAIALGPVQERRGPIVVGPGS